MLKAEIPEASHFSGTISYARGVLVVVCARQTEIDSDARQAVASFFFFSFRFLFVDRFLGVSHSYVIGVLGFYKKTSPSHDVNNNNNNNNADTIHSTCVAWIRPPVTKETNVPFEREC
jgi:hypothetical protein